MVAKFTVKLFQTKLYHILEKFWINAEVFEFLNELLNHNLYSFTFPGLPVASTKVLVIFNLRKIFAETLMFETDYLVGFQFQNVKSLRWCNLLVLGNKQNRLQRLL